MTDLRIGVVGAMGRGTLASHGHLPGKGSRVAACFDISDENLQKAKALYGDDLQATLYLPEFLSWHLDAAFVCSPDHCHEDQAVALLEAGIPVYLEKPIAITIEGCDRILQTCAGTGTKLYVGHNMRHMPFVLKMKQLIDEGAIGEVKAVWCRHFVGNGGDFYFRDWHADRRNTTGLLLQKAAHDIDIIHWLAGGFGRRVHAMGGLTVYGDVKHRSESRKRKGPLYDLNNWPPLTAKDLHPVVDVEDLSMLNMELENGVFASYQQCHYTPDYWRNYTVIGTEGRIENFGDGEQGTHIKLWNQRSLGYNGDGHRTFDIPVVSGSHGGADPRIVREFLDYVRGTITPTTSPVGARYSVAVGCCATDSLRNGGIPIDVPPLDSLTARHFI